MRLKDYAGSMEQIGTNNDLLIADYDVQLNETVAS